jgi:hypothetical protein
LSPLVGRDEEFDLLLRRWARAKAGDGQVMLVSGESGIGKSRITAELAKRLRTEPHLRPRYFGLSTSSDERRGARPSWRNSNPPAQRTHNIRKMLFVSVAPYCCSSSPKLYVPSK